MCESEYLGIMMITKLKYNMHKYPIITIVMSLTITIISTKFKPKSFYQILPKVAI